MVEIYIVNIHKELNIFDLREKLSFFTSNKTISSNINKQKTISELGYAFLQRIICEKLDLKNPSPISYTDKGKPYFAKLPNIHFNISHSGSYICIAISDKDVGIDIERIRVCNPELVKRFFHKQEIEDILSIPEGEDRNLYFTKIWSLKESYVKCIGSGLANVFNTFSLKAHHCNNIQISGNAKNVWFKGYNVLESYQLSICSFSNSFPEIPTLLPITYFLA